MRAPTTRLSVMMFLQYAIWGAWLPILYPYLAGHRSFTPGQIGDIFAVGAIGAILAPFIAGQAADRFVPTQKFLAVSHILGAGLIWHLASVESYGGFLAFSLVYSIVYAPTLSLTNSIAFHHLPDRDRDFGKVRVWGTVGWIAVGIGVGQWLLYKHTPSGEGVTQKMLDAAHNAGRADAFKLSAVLGLVQGVFCWTLPHTPPSKGKEKNAPMEALREVKKSRALLVLFLISIPVSCIHQFYFVHASGYLSTFQSKFETTINSVFGVGGGGLMTVGQMVEVGVLAAIPLLAKRVSRKQFLLAGLAAYTLRMVLYVYARDLPFPLTAAILGTALHGFCFGCFIFVAFMIVDEETTPDVRASAQSLYNLVIVGIGIIVGSKIAGAVAEWAASGDKLDYANTEHVKSLFGVPMWAAAACFVIVLVAYPKGRKAPDA